MDKYVCKLELGNVILNGEITRIIESYRTTFGPTDEECGYDVVEVSVKKGEMPIFQIGDTKYIGSKPMKDSFFSVLVPIEVE